MTAVAEIADHLGSPEAERQVLGVMMLSSEAAGNVVQMLQPGDFRLPRHQLAFAAIKALHGRGRPTDAASVAEECKRTRSKNAPDVAELALLAGDTGAISSASHYAEIVASYALRRRLVGEGAQLQEAAKDPTKDVGQLLTDARANLAAIDTPIGIEPHLIDAWLPDPDEPVLPWLIPGIVRQQMRIMLTGGEGMNKSTTLRQIAVATAYGVHPFIPSRNTLVAQPVLIIDCENDLPDIRYDRYAGINSRLGKTFQRCALPGRTPAPLMIHHYPQGIDLRQRAARLELEESIRRTEPALVVGGPLYKLFRQSARERDEHVAAEVQAILDDLRVRYDFALMLEHHSAKGESRERSYLPSHSSYWLRWPHIGLGMVRKAQNKEDPTVKSALKRWRGDRTVTDWPDELHRPSAGLDLPWVGWWADGVPPEDGSEEDPF